MPTPTENKLRGECCVEAALFKDKLARAGLFATMQKMEEVVKEVGWETARLREKNP